MFQPFSERERVGCRQMMRVTIANESVRNDWAEIVRAKVVAEVDKADQRNCNGLRRTEIGIKCRSRDTASSSAFQVEAVRIILPKILIVADRDDRDAGFYDLRPYRNISRRNDLFPADTSRPHCDEEVGVKYDNLR